jgi:HlyD family secretion protein
MDPKQLYRKAAVDKLASPEQLDVMMQVTSPKGWLALVTVGGILVGVVFWSVFGSIPTRIEAEGILIRGGSLRELEATGQGELVELTIAVNDTVEPGQTIGRIDLPNLEDQIRSAQIAYEQKERDYQSAFAEDSATIAGHRADLRRIRAELDKVEQELEIKRESYEKGLITRSRILALERDKVNLESNVTSLNAGIRQIEQRLRQRKLAVDAAQRQWEELQGQEERVSTVESTVAGRVIELKKRVGDQVRNGEVIAILEPFTGAMEPVVYVSSTKGKQIQAGMEAQISPTTVKKEEFGYMKAKVASVGDYPVTPEGVMSVVANEALVQELLGGSSKIEVRAELISDKETPSGYEWSSSEGPPFKIAGGTRVNVSFIVDRRAPYTYVLPVIKSTLGVS